MGSEFGNVTLYPLAASSQKRMGLSFRLDRSKAALNEMFVDNLAALRIDQADL